MALHTHHHFLFLPSSLPRSPPSMTFLPTGTQARSKRVPTRSSTTPPLTTPKTTQLLFIFTRAVSIARGQAVRRAHVSPTAAIKASHRIRTRWASKGRWNGAADSPITPSPARTPTTALSLTNILPLQPPWHSPPPLLASQPPHPPLTLARPLPGRRHGPPGSIRRGWERHAQGGREHAERDAHALRAGAGCGDGWRLRLVVIRRPVACRGSFRGMRQSGLLWSRRRRIKLGRGWGG